MRQINLRTIIILFIFLIFNLMAGDFRLCSNKQNNMSLELKIDIIKKPRLGKKIFVNKERLIIEVKLINKTNQNVYVEPIINNATLDFIIKDENNEDIQRKFVIVEPQINDNYYKVIKPFKEYKENINLLDSDEYIFKPGSVYYISAVYSSKNPHYYSIYMKSNIKIFEGQLHSNTLVLRL